jgi:hypothetical protein
VLLRKLKSLQNDLVGRLELALGLERSWTYGACQRLSIRLMRAVTSERRIPAERWHTVVPVVEQSTRSTRRRASC